MGTIDRIFPSNLSWSLCFIKGLEKKKLSKKHLIWSLHKNAMVPRNLHEVSVEYDAVYKQESLHSFQRLSKLFNAASTKSHHPLF